MYGKIIYQNINFDGYYNNYKKKTYLGLKFKILKPGRSRVET